MALVRRLLGDAQAKLRKMVDDNLQVATRADCDLSIDRTEAADPLITPATDSTVGLSLVDGICRPPTGSPSRPPSHNDRSKFYTASYLDNDKKAAIALDRKINFNSSLSNSNDQKTLGKNNTLEKNMNGNDAHYALDSIPGTSRSTRLSLSNKQTSRTSFAERSSCSAINEIENENLMDGFDSVDNEYPMNGMLGSPALNHQNGGDRASYAEIVVPISKYADRNILDAESSEADDDIAPSENGSGTSPRATETGTQENDDTSGRSGSGREGSVPPGDESDRRGLGSGSCGGSVGGISPAPASPRAITAADAARRLRHENERLKGEAARLRRLLVAAAERGEAGAALLAGNNATTPDPPPPEGSEAARIRTLEAELKMAREAVIALKADRKRLKAEKFDLLNQMKQLYASLEDKERELRDFIRNYEQMRSSSGSARRAEERELLARRARDEAERCLALAARLSARELQLQHARDQLHEARRQLQAGGWVSDQESLGSLPRQGGGALTPGGSASGGLLGPTLGLALAAGDRGSCSADSGVRVTGSSDRESGATSIGGNLSDSTTDGTPTITLGGDGLDMDSISVVSSIQQAHLYHLPVTTPKDCSPTLSPHNSNPFSRSIENSVLSRSVEQLSGLGEREAVAPRLRGRSAVGGGPGGGVGSGARSGRGPSAWGSISRVFARSRHRNKPPSVGPHDCESLYDCRGSWVGQNMGPSSGPGAEAALREAASLPLERWRAPAVRAWLDIALGMPPQYGAKCAENIKSGKVLLELTDSELETGLGIVHPMHRKKLRLAIEEHRNPDMVRHPAITQLGHDWVASEWLPDLGLSQYAENFAANMVDARMLDNLSKKELEKYLGVTRKFHQASIVHGIHLLRLMKYDRQALALRRHQCETIDADPLVWTNQRFMRWARNIDLAEYADNLKDSGVHGGLVVLEPSFTGDTMATALGVPPARAIIRRHLAQQLDALVLPARNSLGALPARRIRTSSGFGTMSSSGSSGRANWRSLAGLEAADMAAKNIKGSITRALGLKPKQEKTSPSSSSESSSIMSRWGKPSPPRTRSHLSIGHPSIGRPSSSLDYDDSAICIYESPQSLYDSPSSCYNPSHLSFRVSSQQSINSNIYSNGSQCFDIAELSGVSHRTYSQRSVNSHRVSSPLPIHEEVESSFKQKRHRRVRSIGDIEAAATLPV